MSRWRLKEQFKNSRNMFKFYSSSQILAITRDLPLKSCIKIGPVRVFHYLGASWAGVGEGGGVV